jgi:cellulose synthase/poly-beta-1,6-N-acetylglucosamine synthase-like glycosyltransferase/spore germination protein YaaH/peptidoglycan/xylan/chitin deacetylase (PgdA/CDA1 family)
MQGRQIFETDSSLRWKRFKWSSRVLLLLVPLAAIVLTIAYIFLYVPNIPPLKARALVEHENFLSKNSLLEKKYKGFRKYIDQKELTNRSPYATRVPARLANIVNGKTPCPIRSAFYVTWNQQSFYSLQRNIHKLNLVVPEWLFIDPKTDTLVSTMDDKGFAVMKTAGVNIMPMLSNFFDSTHRGNGRFYGDAVHRIITDRSKREKLINDLIAVLGKNKFTGVNIDFEELQEKSDENFVAFQKELYQKLHAKGFLVSQDVIPFNGDYDYRSLSAYNDFLFVMAYDEYARGTKPGPIAEQKWIEAAVDDAVKKIPASKVILGVAAYGYNWPVSKETNEEDVEVLTYQDALSTAKDEQARIDFDNDTYNLHFSYYDDENIPHEVYFTDAATTFNAMRFATESEIAGVALWRLGSEDERTWKFYDKNMSKDSISNFDFASFANIQAPDNVSYFGHGEVLDILATPHEGNIHPDIDSVDILIAEENYDSLPVNFTAKKFGWNGSDTTRNKKKLVLTFDDGPDPTWTPKVLNILSEKHVPASFFIVGLNAENNIPLVKRIYREGHEIGDHTFTHPNIAEVSRSRAIIEMEATRLLIECITGHSTILFRAPYNADFEPQKTEELLPVAIARTKNYLDVGESIDPLDWEPGVSADTIFHRIIMKKQELDGDRVNSGGNIILLHDAGGETRRATLEALPRIIDYFQKRGYTFTTIADLLGKKKEDLMPPVPKGSGYYLLEANYVFLEVTMWAGHILTSLFMAFIVLSIARILLMAVLAMKERRREKMEALALPLSGSAPLVSIIVPAYNEEVNALSSLQNLLRTDYPNFNIIFVDDGSKDDTYEKVAEVFASHPKVKVFTKANGGKASALNFGIARTEAEYVVCIDADTKLKPDAVSQLMKHLVPREEWQNNTANQDKSNRETGEPFYQTGMVGAVAGNVKVGNEVNLLTKWQAIEYISSQNFDRRAFASLNAITVVPGAIGAFLKKAIEDAGGFTTDTLAEDCDLTIRVIRAGYIIENENSALAFTEAPENTRQFVKQRFRWSFGVLQTFWKHKDVLFNTKYGWLGWLALPNILLFQYIIPTFIPLADFFMLVGLFTGNGSRILPYYAAFMIFDAGISIIAFRMEGERISRLVWLIPQRLIYRWLMWYVLFKSFRKAIKGELQNWGVLKRTGRVREEMIVDS